MRTKILIFSAAALLIAGSCGRKAETTEPEAQVKQSGNEQVAAQQASLNESSELGRKASQKHGTVKLTKEDFLKKVMNYEVNQTEWKYAGEKPCLIDFYADWCGPCRITSPILEELALEYGDKIVIYKVDTDKERELASVFGIRGIPSFLLCPMEGQPTMKSGIAQTKEETKEMFKQLIDEILLLKKEG